MGKYSKVVATLVEQKKELPVENPGYQDKLNAFKELVRTNDLDDHLGELHDTIDTLESAVTLSTREVVGGHHTAASLVEVYRRLREEREMGEALVSLLRIRETAFEQMVIASYLTSENDATSDWGKYGAQSNNVRMADGYTLSVNPDLSIKTDDPEAFAQWCRDNGWASKMTLHPGTRDSIAKEMLQSGKGLPAGLDAFPMYRVRLAKPRMKGDTDE